MITDIKKQGEDVRWQDLTTGCIIDGGGTAKEFNTGEWRIDTPVFIEYARLFLIRINANSVCSAFRFARTAPSL